MQKEISFNEFCKFQPKQLEADKAVLDYTYLFYGGSAGGGKSYFLRWEAVKLLLRFYKKYRLKGIRVGLFCEDYPALRERHLSKIVYEFPPELGTLNKSDHEFVLKDQLGGGVVAFRNLDDPSKYLSSEFAAILVDELTKNPRETFDFLNMRRRWPGIGDTKFIGASNPGGIGHGYVKKLWIDRDFSDEQFDPKEFGFVRARVEDNKYLGQEYINILEQLPEKLRKAYREGSWDIFAGQYFTEWNSEHHICDPFEIPEGWTRIRCLDYGQSKPSAVYWLAIDYDGNVYVYRELYETGHTYQSLAQKIVAMTPNDEIIDYTVADTSVFDKSPDTGKDGDDIFAEYGCPISPANKERIIGWNLFREYLRNDIIVFFSSCTQAIRTIPALVYYDMIRSHNKAKAEDLDTSGDDHCLDGDTLVDTVNGQLKIKDLVGKSGYCYTPEGVERFYNVRLSGFMKTFKVKFNNNKHVIATDRHRFLTRTGWKRLEDLKTGDEVIDNRSMFLIQSVTWKLKLLVKLVRSFLGKGITYAVTIFKETGKGFIELFGLRTTGVFQLDSISTTKMEIGQTMNCQTLNCCEKANIYRFILRPKKQDLGQESQSRLRENLLKHGISQRSEKSSTGLLLNKVGLIKYVFLKIARFVARNISLLSQIGLSIVMRIARLRRYACVENIIELNSRNVYDLEVDNVQCFSVNGGLIVHNSADALRYGLMSLPPIPIKKKEELNLYKEDKDSPWYHKNTKFNYNQLYK